MGEVGAGRVIAERYTIGERLGRGGMGEVFAARDEVLGRDVAIKVIPSTSSGDADSRQRLMREARAVSRIEHPGIVRVFDVGETSDGFVYLVMERVRGETLRGMMSKGALPLDLASRLTTELAELLDAAHRVGLVHRDVKPDNVMVRADGRVALLDFGIAKTFRGSGIASAAAGASVSLTVEGAVVGTPAYLSPEQANGEEVGPPSDQFALAVTAFEMVCGRLPWTAANNFALIGKILSEDAPPPSSIRDALPSGVDAVFARALAKDPEARFPSVTAFAESLDLARRASDTEDRSFSLPPPRAVQTDGASTITAEQLRAGSPRSLRRWRAATVIVAAVAVAAIAARQLWAHFTAPVVVVTAPPPRALLACPQLDAGDEADGWLGAASADLACRALSIVNGGAFERTLRPAELLDLPRAPGPGFPEDPYTATGARAKEIDAAKLRAARFVDGRVARAPSGFTIDLRLVDATSLATIAVAHAVHASLVDSVNDAIDQLRASPDLHANDKLAPDRARWFGTEDPDALLFADRFDYSGKNAAACAEAKKMGDKLGRNWPPIARACGFPLPPPVLDDRSNEGLARTADEYARERLVERGERIALELEAARERETSVFGRATLAIIAGNLWQHLAQRDRAAADYLEAIHDHPRFGEWTLLAMTSDSDDNALGAAAWEPADLGFTFQGRARRDLQLRFLRRRFILSNAQADTAAELADVLAFTGNRAELLGLAGAMSSDASVHEHLFAVYERSGGNFQKALDAEKKIVLAGQANNDHPTRDLIHLADLLGEGAAVADAWLDRFVTNAGPRGWDFETVAVAMCARASAAVATKCIAKLDAEVASMSADVATFYEGAKRYARGDHAGARKAWRRLVIDNVKWFHELMPMDAFASGDAVLAAKLDADSEDDRGWNGISLATPRAAERAAHAGDVETAKRLAEKTIAAWAAADAPVPAVASMRTLLTGLR